MAWVDHGQSLATFSHTSGGQDFYDPAAPKGFAANVSVGHQVFVVTVGEATGVSDGQGNSYAADGAFGEVTIWRAPVTTALTTSDEVTVAGDVWAFTVASTDAGVYVPTDPGDPLDTAIFNTASGEFTVPVGGEAPPGTVVATVPFVDPGDFPGLAVGVYGNYIPDGLTGGITPQGHGWTTIGVTLGHPLVLPSDIRWDARFAAPVSGAGNPSDPNFKYEFQLSAASFQAGSHAYGLIVLYRAADWTGPEPDPPDLAAYPSVDLAQAQVPFVFRAYRDGTDVVVERTRNMGDSWE